MADRLATSTQRFLCAAQAGGRSLRINKAKSLPKCLTDAAALSYLPVMRRDKATTWWWCEPKVRLSLVDDKAKWSMDDINEGLNRVLHHLDGNRVWAGILDLNVIDIDSYEDQWVLHLKGPHLPPHVNDDQTHSEHIASNDAAPSPERGAAYLPDLITRGMRYAETARRNKCLGYTRVVSSQMRTSNDIESDHFQYQVMLRAS